MKVEKESFTSIRKIPESLLGLGLRLEILSDLGPIVPGQDSFFNCGNKITSRIDCELVSTITKRSIPIPSPAVGGNPYSKARIKSRSIM